jgi:hypothetical protein
MVYFCRGEMIHFHDLPPVFSDREMQIVRGRWSTLCLYTGPSRDGALSRLGLEPRTLSLKGRWSNQAKNRSFRACAASLYPPDLDEGRCPLRKQVQGISFRIVPHAPTSINCSLGNAATPPTSRLPESSEARVTCTDPRCGRSRA